MSVARWKPIRELVGSFFIVTIHDGQPLSKHQCTYLDPLLKDKFPLPNLQFFCDKFYTKQTFHEMKNDQRQQVIQAFEMGIDEDKFNSIIHSILQQHRQQSYISTEKLKKQSKTNITTVSYKSLQVVVPHHSPLSSNHIRWHLHQLLFIIIHVQ